MSDDQEITANLPATTTMDFPDALPLMPLDDMVVFPLAIVPLSVSDKEEVLLLRDAVKGHRLLAMAALRVREGDRRNLKNVFTIGCIGRILDIQDGPNNTVNAVVQAVKRFRITGLVRRDPYLMVRVLPLETPPFDPDEVKVYERTIKTQMGTLIAMAPNLPDNARMVIESITDPAFLTDLVTSNLTLKMEEKQEILELVALPQRMKRLMYLLQRELELVEASSKIQQEVKSSIEKGQREFFLRQQLKAIQEELGEGDGRSEAAAGYREKIEALGLPPDALKEVSREVERFSRMNEASADYHVTATYLDTIVELPWNKVTEDILDIELAEAVLDEDHFGLEKVKKRILEYLAVRKLKPSAHGPILCFQGPPGVGKTSLGKSIARAMGREFVRMALGGLHDEAEIRGHRKTYVGAMPGRIIQGIRKAGTRNPVFMLDEIDKVGQDFRGDPSSALLEVLDPAQNDTFTDNYLNVPFDLSKTMFIATANVLDTIPWALRDRMEIITLSGYTLEEKVQIARRYLVPRQLDEHGLTEERLSFSIAALRRIVSGYTHEAGVRGLEREIGQVCRGAARQFAARRRKPIAIGPAEIEAYLGHEKIHYDTVGRTRVPGVAIGLAWTALGGDILFIEATRMPGKGNLILTGQLGDVMKESAQTALSFIRANAGKLGLEASAFSEFDLHVHVPAGAVPKDGPSAGVTMLTAIVSLLTGKRVRAALAMTGEITLRGAVLPVGGIKEKVLAAARAGVKRLILPEKCREEFEEVPEAVRAKLEVHFVARMHEVLSLALGVELGK